MEIIIICVNLEIVESEESEVRGDKGEAKSIKRKEEWREKNSKGLRKIQ